MQYVISWVHKGLYGMKGTGTNRYSKEDADKLARNLNLEYPHIAHKAIPESEAPTPRRYPSHD